MKKAYLVLQSTVFLVLILSCKNDEYLDSTPVADFSSSKTNVVKNETIQFTDQSTNNPTSWFWDFGDSATSTEQNPTKEYTTAGTYTISLKATNSYGNNTKTKLSYITVSSSDGISGPIEMVLVQGGAFPMGSYDGSNDERPIQSVKLDSFYIGKTEVTQKQWRDVIGSNPSGFKGDNLPVEKVSWNEVQTYIQKLNQQTGKNYRLPTEAEWEFAARGGKSRKGYAYSGSNIIGDVAWYNGNSGNTTHPVGTKAANELGLFDMSGNVLEWCNDMYGAYSSAVQTNPTGPASGSGRVFRGGCWDHDAFGCRVARRFHSESDFTFIYLGFRLAHPVE